MKKIKIIIGITLYFFMFMLHKLKKHFFFKFQKGFLSICIYCLSLLITYDDETLQLTNKFIQTEFINFYRNVCQKTIRCSFNESYSNLTKKNLYRNENRFRTIKENNILFLIKNMLLFRFFRIYSSNCHISKV